MKKNRVLASIILTAGLGMSGVTAASASDAAPAKPEHGKGKHVCVIIHKEKGHKGSDKPEKSRVEVKDGKYYVNGKEVAKDKLPGKGKCPLPPLPGHGKGKVICVIIHKGDGEWHGKHDQVVAKGADGKAHVNGKEISKDKLPHHKLPPGSKIICHKVPHDGPGHGKGKETGGNAGKGASVVDTAVNTAGAVVNTAVGLLG